MTSRSSASTSAEGGGFQKPVHLREGGFEPARVIVIRNAAAGTVGIAGDIGRVGNHKIDALRLHRAHDLNAVAMQYSVEVGGGGRGQCACHGVPLFVIGLIEKTKRAGL
jgi:hypothetical protein